jgi:glucokinase
VVDYVGKRVGIGGLVVESDRNASVLGEAWAGAARGARDAIYLIVGTGIGAGIISGGELVRGAAELSGCAGWLVAMDCDGRMRPLEELSAGPAIGRAGAKALGAREASAQQVFELAATGNTAAQAVIENAAQNLGIAVANLISLFNPEVVVLGGGVGTAGPALLDPLRATALRWAQPLAAKSVRIEASTLGANAPLLGAAYLALNVRRSR